MSAIEYFTKHYLDHSQGINKYSSELLLRDQELLDSKNARSVGGDILSRRGYRALGSIFKTEIDLDGAGNAAIVNVAGTCTLTVARVWKITPTAGESIKISGYTNAGNNGTFTVSSATSTTVVYANASGVNETVTMTTATIEMLENISTIFEYNNSNGASYLIGVGHLGVMKVMLAPDSKQFTVEQGASGAVFEANKTYRFGITNVDLDGRESTIGEIISITPSEATATLELSDISVSPSNVYKKNIYRTIADGDIFYTWPATMEILNGTTTLSNSITDGNLAAGSVINSDQIYELDWGEVLDYHGKIQQFDTTRKTNFIMHKDWAIAMNGVDRIKWRAPKKLGLFSSEATADNFLYYIVTDLTYLEHDYPIGMHIGKYKDSIKLSWDGFMVLDNEEGLKRVKLRSNATAANDGLYASGRHSTPFGVPYIDATSATGTTIAAGAAGNPDGDYTYRIVCSNMNNSEGPDRYARDLGDLTPLNKRSAGDSDSVSVTSDKIELTTISKAPTTQMSAREAGQTLTISNPAGSRMVITRSAAFDFLAYDSASENGEEIEISGSGLSAGNCGKFAIIGTYAAPTLTVIEVHNPNVVAPEGPIACNIAFVEKIDRVTFRKLYRTAGDGAQPHRELKRDTAPTALDAGSSYYTLPDASITSSFSDDVADSDLGLDIYTYYDPTVAPKIPVNDDPPLFLHADSKDNMLIAGNMDFKGLTWNSTDPGPLCIMVFNYDEVEGVEFSRFTPLGYGNKDSTQVKGIKVLKDAVIGFSEKKAYRFENLLELDFGIAPKREVVSGSTGCRDARSLQVINADDGTQTLIYMGHDGLYEILESGLSMALGRLPIQKLKDFFDKTLTGERGRTQDNMPSCVQEGEHKYIVAMKENSNSVNDIIIAYDYKNRAYWFWDNFDAVDLCYWEDKLIHCSGQQAYWEQNKGRDTDYSDNGYAIEAYVETRPYHMDQPDQIKKWDKITVYQAKDNEDQVLSITSRSNFGSIRTNIGRGATALPWGYTSRSLSVNGVILSVTFQSGTTWRYTRTGGAAFNFTTAGLIVGDRIRIIDSSPFLRENRGDFVVSAVAATYFEISNEWGFPESSVTLTAANQFIGYYPTSPVDEMDGIDTLFKNLVFTGVRDPFEIKMAPSSSRFVSIRFESFLNNKRLALSGWTMKYGYSTARGNERGGND